MGGLKPMLQLKSCHQASIAAMQQEESRMCEIPIILDSTALHQGYLLSLINSFKFADLTFKHLSLNGQGKGQQYKQ